MAEHDAGRLQIRFREGIALHRQGHIDAAERIYRDILARQSGHFDATHMLGVALLQRRRTKEGIALIRQAISLNGEAASAHVNLGKAHRCHVAGREPARGVTRPPIKLARPLALTDGVTQLRAGWRPSAG